MPIVDVTSEPIKPRLRGIFHEYAFVAAVAAGAMLVALAEGARARTAAWVYAGSLVIMFGASALYHRVPWRSASVRAWMRRLDHCGIFLLIAGTYTPFALLVFDAPWATLVLVLVWVGAAFGIVLNVAWIEAPRWLVAAVYLALGWVGVAGAAAALRRGSGLGDAAPRRRWPLHRWRDRLCAAAAGSVARRCSASTSCSTCSSSPQP